LEETEIIKNYRESIVKLLEPLKKYGPEIEFDNSNNTQHIFITIAPWGNNISIDDLSKFQEHIGKPISIDFIKDEKIYMSIDKLSDLSLD
jgi:hypothetical protein